ncbi:mitochondrial ribosomal death-associated protein 3-domain-containing protein [Aspergillus egyptiacus]|nr:mitochondrial ribosomal death-associated protein 3-domain-containing protein [Aspergillus egyptiacus]
MVFSFCRSCLTQLRQAPRSVPSWPTALPRGPAFHTTAGRYESPLTRKKTRAANARVDVPKYRVPSSAKMKKKKRPTERSRPPAFGERKALRKRIVLSNPNALEVEGMPELTEQTMVDSRLRGTVVGLPVPMIDQLRAVQAFKPSQGWSIFRRPGTVMRRETLEMGRLFDSISGEGEGQGTVVKKVITGARKSGKSVHLLQAIAMGFTNKWVVITVPEAKELVDATTSYAPLSEDSPLYVQNEATAALLSRTITANGQVLRKLHVSLTHSVLPAAKPGMTLEDLAKIGVQDPASSWRVFQALWAELTATSAAPGLESHFTPRPPLLVTVDGLAHWMTETEYFGPDLKRIHAHDFVFVRHFLSLLKPGKDKAVLPNGGAIIYSTSTSNNPHVYSFDIALKQVAARHAGVDPSTSEFPQPEPYSYVDSRVLEALESTKPTVAKEGMLQVQTLGGLTRDEARGFLEYFARSGLLRESITDEWVSEKWTLAGGGLIGELERIGRRARLPAA